VDNSVAEIQDQIAKRACGKFVERGSAAGFELHERLQETFEKKTHMRCNAWAGLWSFYMFVGERASTQQLEVA